MYSVLPSQNIASKNLKCKKSTQIKLKAVAKFHMI